MKVLDKGHVYALDHLDGEDSQKLIFVNREAGREEEGTTTQECLRMLIDRTWYCNDCLPWSGNKLIVDHLRMALMLHEVRAMIRKVEKGEIEPEKLAVGHDGHFILGPDVYGTVSGYAKMPDTGTETGSLNPGLCKHHEEAKKLKAVK